jgi:hypothetical protein
MREQRKNMKFSKNSNNLNHVVYYLTCCKNIPDRQFDNHPLKKTNMWHIKSRYYALKIALFSHSILPPKHPEQTVVRVNLLLLPLQCCREEGL